MYPRRLLVLLVTSAWLVPGCVQEVDVLGSPPAVGASSGGSWSGGIAPGSSGPDPTAPGETDGGPSGGMPLGCADLASFCPSPGATLHVQLSEEAIDTELDVDAYVVDLFEAEEDALLRLAERGLPRVCWIGAGNWEPWRPDANDFPPGALGSALDGFEDERWLNVRSAAVRDVISARFDLAIARGCDAVLATNTDGYRSANGHGLTAADALDYHAWLANQAHNRGISIGLGGDLAQGDALSETYDWAYDVGCLADDACAPLSKFIEAGAAVFSVELVDELSQGPDRLADVCPAASTLGFSTQVKQPDFGSWFLPC